MRQDSLMSVVVLTGGPAAGKTTVAVAVAKKRDRCAVIDVDDVRHMLHPHVAPWGGEEGQRQQWLGVKNACALAANFVADGCDVVITDVLSADTAALYRSLIEDVVIIRLAVEIDVAVERAEKRHYFLTAEEFGLLHEVQSFFVSFDLELDSTALGVEDLADQVCHVLG